MAVSIDFETGIYVKYREQQTKTQTGINVSDVKPSATKLIASSENDSVVLGKANFREKTWEHERCSNPVVLFIQNIFPFLIG